MAEEGSIYIDADNAVEITELGIQLEAVEDKIIVLTDAFKSGYECKDCNGTGKVKSIVTGASPKECPSCNGKGTLLVIPEISKTLPTLGTIMSVGPETKWGKSEGSLRKAVHDKNAINVLEMEAKYYDEKIANLKAEQKYIKCRVGAKVLFSPHVGTLIPIKGQVRLKIMREHEPLAVIYGAEFNTKDFLDYDVPIDQRY